MPRLFTGLEIPVDVGAEIASLRGGLPNARWIDPEDYHVTLRFIGDVGVALANEIAHELDAIRRREIIVAIEGLGVFGGDKPRSIYARVAATEPLCALQGEHERLMRRIGLAPETRRFTPHVTLARLRGATPESVAAYVESRGSVRAPSFRAQRFALFSSRESTGGGPYRVEADYPL
ncbi:MAG: RNA 2',3'-cyclic phosphodiesterase [Hyphomicrobiales bacterium]|nr:RNA 2',3'-cyclic phosphodiesterase [Hyphomicrobiales bacterium]